MTVIDDNYVFKSYKNIAKDGYYLHATATDAGCDCGTINTALCQQQGFENDPCKPHRWLHKTENQLSTAYPAPRDVGKTRRQRGHRVSRLILREIGLARGKVFEQVDWQSLNASLTCSRRKKGKRKNPV